MPAPVQFAGLVLTLPPEWLDITEEGEPPTLGQADGVGVIQFSVARYASGVEPNIDLDALRNLLVDFGRTRRLGEPRRMAEGQGAGTNRFVSGEFAPAGERVAVWYVSNGRDVALITYVTLLPDDPRAAEELAQASLLIEGLDFA